MRIVRTTRSPGTAALALAAVVTVVATPPAPAHVNIRLELAALAKAVRQVLDSHGATDVAVGAFAAPADSPGSAGPGLVQMAREELERLGLRVQGGARFVLKGSYRDVIDGTSGRLIIKLSAGLEDRTGKKLIDLEARGIYGEEAVAEMLGLTVALPPGADLKRRSHVIVQTLDDAVPPHVVGGRVKANADSPYGVELLVKGAGGYVPRAAKIQDGLAYVPLQRDEVYAVRLVNGSAHEAAVTLTIDGLNLFAFHDLKDPQTGRPLLSTLVVPPGKSVLVPGWPVSLRESNEFLVTAYARSAAKELNSQESVGVVTATFAAAWPRGGPRPADEPKGVPREARAGDATGRGARVEADYDTVAREFGVLRASVSVRYSK